MVAAAAIAAAAMAAVAVMVVVGMLSVVVVVAAGGDSYGWRWRWRWQWQRRRSLAVWGRGDDCGDGGDGEKTCARTLRKCDPAVFASIDVINICKHKCCARPRRERAGGPARHQGGIFNDEITALVARWDFGTRSPCAS